MIEKGGVGDAIEPGEELRTPVESAERFPGFPIRLLRQIGGEVAIAAQAEQRCIDRGVRPLDELFRRGAIAAPNRCEQAVLFAPWREHRVKLRLRSGERRNVLHTSWTPLRDS